MNLGKNSRAPMTNVTDEQDIQAAFNLCFMKHKIIGSEEERHKLETKLKSLGQTRKVVQVEEQEPHEGLFYGNYSPPNLPPVPSLHQFIGICSEPFEKQLTPSDVRDGQSRLSMSKEYVQQRLMPLLNENEDLNEGIDVMTYDLAGKEYPMKFRTWVGKIHVLTAGWKAFRKDHDLVENQNWVTVWMFRNIATSKLCFVIDVRKLPVYETVKRRRTRLN